MNVSSLNGNGRRAFSDLLLPLGQPLWRGRESWWGQSLSWQSRGRTWQGLDGTASLQFHPLVQKASKCLREAIGRQSWKTWWCFFFFSIYFLGCIYPWLRWVFVAAHGPSLVADRRGRSGLGARALTAVASCRGALALGHMGFSSCSNQAPGRCRLDNCGWHMGLVAPEHVGSSQTRDRTGVPCTARWILNHRIPQRSPVAVFFLRHPLPGCHRAHECGAEPVASPAGCHFPDGDGL